MNLATLVIDLHNDQFEWIERQLLHSLEFQPIRYEGEVIWSLIHGLLLHPHLFWLLEHLNDMADWWSMNTSIMSIFFNVFGFIMLVLSQKIRNRVALVNTKIIVLEKIIVVHDFFLIMTNWQYFGRH